MFVSLRKTRECIIGTSYHFLQPSTTEFDSLTRFYIQRINKQTRKKLETLTASLALATSANKKQIAESFIIFANEHNNRQYRYLCCVDVGSRNLAWITYDCEQNVVVQWSKLDIAEKVTVAKYHQRVQTLIHNHLLLPGSSPNDYKVYIERQFFASPSNKIIESLLFAAICNQASELNPRTLGSFRVKELTERRDCLSQKEKDLLKDKTGMTDSQKYTTRKKQAVALVRQFVKENTLPFDKEDTAAVFEGSKKKDDLSDAYVMLKYMLNSIKVVKEWYEDFKSEKREKE